MPNFAKNPANDVSATVGQVTHPRHDSATMILARLHASQHDHLPKIGSVLAFGERVEQAVLATLPTQIKDDLASTLHVMPLALFDEVYLHHVLFWSASGLDDRVVEVVKHLRSLPSLAHPKQDALAVEIVECGDTATLLNCPRVVAVGLSAYLQPSSIWYTRTPMVLACAHANDAQSVASFVQDELAQRDLPAALTVEVIDGAAEQLFGFAEFECGKTYRLQPNRPWAMRLEFAKAIPGPIALGLGSRYGLGLFEGD